MQMPISQAAPGSSPATAVGTSGKSAGGEGFVQTLVQSITGTGSGTAQSAANAAPAVKVATASQLSSLLGENVSAADLIAAITEMLKKLDALNDQQGDAAVSKEDLTDALQQVEVLLALFGAAPMIPQPVGETEAALGGAGQGQIPVLGSETSPEAVIQAANPALSGNQMLAAAASVQPAAAQFSAPEMDSNEAVAVLKAGLQDALVDLRTLLQQNRGSRTSRDLLSAVGNQLAEVEQKLDGRKQGNFQLQQAAVPGEEILDTVKSLQTTSAPLSHLQRMAHQLFHVGALAARSVSDEQSVEEAGTVMTESLGPEMPVVSAANQELQRQIQAARPLIAQPVPVQQFAENMQNLIVKQFNVSAVGGMSEARLTLTPEHLGHVDVRITVQNGLLTAVFLTDTSAAKDMLENQMAQLRASLQSQGLQVDKLEVSQNTVQTSLFQDRQGQHGREQQAGKRNKTKDDSIEGITSFESDLEELALDQAVDRHMGLGRGIHTSA